MTAMRPFGIATASDETYFGMLQGLVRSIRSHAQGADTPVVVLDLGLGAESRAWLAGNGARCVIPGDDSATDRPLPTYFKAMLSRPHLPKYLTEVETILWLDADTWIQDWRAVELLLWGAAASGFAIAPELDRSYTPFYGDVPYVDHLYDWYRRCFDEATAKRLFAYPLLNCGVFAARVDAPHWQVWARLLNESLSRTILFVSEQVALNVALRTQGLPVSLLPASCNWICFRAQPFCSEDGQQLLDPQVPYAPLGIVHLAGFDHTRKATATALSTPSGRTVVRPLTYIGPGASPTAQPAGASPAEALRQALALYREARHTEALRLCRAVVVQHPELAGAWCLAGVVAFALGRNDESSRWLGIAIALQPNFTDAFVNLGLLRRHQGRPGAAATLQSIAIRVSPDRTDALLNRGAARLDMGDYESAAADFAEAVRLRPEDPQARDRLGAAQRQQGKVKASVATHQRAAALRPDGASYRDLGHALREAGAFAAAAIAYRRAYRLDPSQTEGLSELLFMMLSICDWDGHDDLCRQLRTIIDQDRGMVLPLVSLLIGSDAAQQDRAARRFSKTMIGSGQGDVPAASARASAPDRLTIAYMSADFHDHATARLTAELFELHDRDRFRVVAYSYGPDDGSPMRRRLERAFDAFRDIRRCTIDEVAGMVAADGIDILIDLKGYTKHSRLDLLTRRLAPVQVAYLGYPGTMGCEIMDYVVGDRFVTPLDHQAHYRERLVIMPDSYQVNDRQRPFGVADPTTPPGRAACGLPDDAFVYCAFHNAYKLNPALFDLWMRILHAVPGSVLWLSEANPAASGNLRRAAAARGIDPNRLVFAPPKPLAEHLARYRLADLGLDSFPYTGHTTTSDALWMGVPMVTCAGATFASRVAAGLLNAAGLPETVTTSFPAYEATAIRLAGEPETLAGYRSRLAAGRAAAPLFDSRRFARHLEQAYALMWARHTAGLPPATITVPPLQL